MRHDNSSSRPAERPPLVLRRKPGRSCQGLLVAGDTVMPCAIGRGGFSALKREGDGATPLGKWALREVLYRPDRVRRPVTCLPVRAITPQSGWCDAARDRNYNRTVRHPYPASAEHLWRDDGVYDLVVVLGYNDRPRARSRGSAIFMHVARRGYAPTEGCVALSRRDLERVLELVSSRATIAIVS